MPTARVNGCIIHYERAGRGRDLVFVHGLFGNMACWYYSILPELMKDFRLCLYDMRGHGYSEVQESGYTSANMAEDLCGLLQHLGIRQAHMVGYSFGGAVALHCVVHHPERALSLTLVDAWIPCFQQPFPGRDAFIARPPAFMSTSEIRQWKKLMKATSVWTEIFEIGDLTTVEMRRVAHPVHAIYGQYSHCLPSLNGIEMSLPRCDAAIVPGLGHFHPMLRPQVLVDNLKQLAESGSS